MTQRTIEDEGIGAGLLGGFVPQKTMSEQGWLKSID
jgi:hypothetical protein